jgi:CO dehydrogenase nickel-insertion accessory protein CooC1
MFEILVDLYVIVAHSMVQLNQLGLVNVGDTEHVLEGCNCLSTRHIAI